MRVKEATDVPEPAGADPVIEVSVRQTGALSKRAKGHPEAQVVGDVERAFERLDLPYRVVWDLPPVQDVPPSKPGREAKRAQLDRWAKLLKRDRTPHVRKDSNLLLTDRSGGGISYLGKRAAIAPGGTLTEDAHLAEWVRPDDPATASTARSTSSATTSTRAATSARGAARGSTSPRGRGTGRRWATSGGVNLCGERNEPNREGYRKRDHLYFHDCAREHIEIQ